MNLSRFPLITLFRLHYSFTETYLRTLREGYLLSAAKCEILSPHSIRSLRCSILRDSFAFKFFVYLACFTILILFTVCVAHILKYVKSFKTLILVFSR